MFWAWTKRSLFYLKKNTSASFSEDSIYLEKLTQYLISRSERRTAYNDFLIGHCDFFQSPTGYCVACSKSFATEKAYENHLRSKKHLEALKAFEQKEDKDEIAKNRRNRKITEETAVEETMEEDADSADEDVEEVIF